MLSALPVAPAKAQDAPVAAQDWPAAQGRRADQAGAAAPVAHREWVVQLLAIAEPPVRWAAAQLPAALASGGLWYGGLAGAQLVIGRGLGVRR